MDRQGIMCAPALEFTSEHLPRFVARVQLSALFEESMEGQRVASC